MRPSHANYLRFERALAVEWFTWSWAFTKKHGGVEVLAAIATACVGGIGDSGSLESALFLGAATLGIMVAGTLLAGMIIGAYRVWSSQDHEIGTLRASISDANARRPSQASLDTLAEMLSEGIHEILNRPVSNEDQLRGLQAYEREWNDRLFSHLEQNFPRADALNIQRLGTVQQRNFPHVRTVEQGAILNHFSRREELIREVIRQGPRA